MLLGMYIIYMYMPNIRAGWVAWTGPEPHCSGSTNLRCCCSSLLDWSPVRQERDLRVNVRRNRTKPSYLMQKCAYCSEHVAVTDVAQMTTGKACSRFTQQPPLIGVTSTDCRYTLLQPASLA